MQYFSPRRTVLKSVIERELERVDGQLLQVNQPMNIAVTMAELREFVARKAGELGEILRGDVATALVPSSSVCGFCSEGFQFRLWVFRPTVEPKIPS